MADLEIRNLHVSAEDKNILKGLDLDVSKGEIHALMGPNGSGKSTLANVIMGHPGLEISEGTIHFKGEDITEAAPEDRSRMGLFMAFQYPVAIPGVTVAKYLRMAVNAHREADGEQQDLGVQEAFRCVRCPDHSKGFAQRIELHGTGEGAFPPTARHRAPDGRSMKNAGKLVGRDEGFADGCRCHRGPPRGECVPNHEPDREAEIRGLTSGHGK